MLFNSYLFIFLFLPISWICFWGLYKKGKKELSFCSLIFFSWIFYAYWKPIFICLLLTSILVNFTLAAFMKRIPAQKKVLFIFGLIFNLGLISYFKYVLFFSDILSNVFDFISRPSDIFLPLGISFFTFQQITYLADIYKDKLKPANFLNYALFVSFFPQLIAGPIVHAKEIIPQFTNFKGKKFFWINMASGLSLFIIGLFKKVVIADNLATFASPVFLSAQTDRAITFFEAWSGALSYTFQLYFDFSGYSDMAIGLALLFGVTLPINFLSPYKSTSISEFWRRWHITMSRFFRDYIYIPLGGNRTTKFKQIRNLTVTMFCAGLWHGAGWTFIVWGLLHGFFLVINYIYTYLRQCFFPRLNIQNKMYIASSHFITLICVVIGWVIFRAESFTSANKILSSMFGFNDIILPRIVFERVIPLDTEGFIRFAHDHEHWLGNSYWCVPWILGAYILCLTLPAAVNIFLITDKEKENAEDHYYNKYPYIFIPLALMAIIALMSLQRISEFLYFQF